MTKAYRLVGSGDHWWVVNSNGVKVGRLVKGIEPFPWTAYRLDPHTGYLGPIGTGGYGRMTRDEALAQLEEALR